MTNEDIEYCVGCVEKVRKALRDIKNDISEIQDENDIEDVKKKISDIDVLLNDITYEVESHFIDY